MHNQNRARGRTPATSVGEVQRIRVLRVVVLVAGCCWESAASAVAATADDREQVRAAAERRRAAADAFHVRLTERIVQSPEFAARLHALRSSSSAEPPEEGFRTEKRWNCLIADDRFRLEQAGEIPNATTGGLTPFGRLSAFNHSFQAALTAPSGSRDFHNAVLQDNNADVEYLALKPLFWQTRPFAERWGATSLRNWRLTEATERVGAHSCRIAHPGDERETFWLDPAADWCVRRYRYAAGGETRTEVEVDYVPDERLGNRPQAWVLRSRSQGRLTSESQVEVADWSWDPAYGDESFEVTLPPRTYIFDQRGGARDHAIVDARGRRRPVQKDDVAHGRLASLMDEQPPEIERPPPFSRLRLICLNLALVLFVLSGWHVVRRRRLQIQQGK